MKELEKRLFELFLWTRGSGSNFAHKLFDLIASADSRNRERIRVGFGLDVAAYELYEAAKSPSELFEKLGFTKIEKEKNERSSQ